eukprot:1176956-Prorocentrum_minimum.AAC.3
MFGMPYLGRRWLPKVMMNSLSTAVPGVRYDASRFELRQDFRITIVCRLRNQKKCWSSKCSNRKNSLAPPKPFTTSEDASGK